MHVEGRGLKEEDEEIEVPEECDGEGDPITG
jgi:hypothetical protein